MDGAGGASELMRSAQTIVIDYEANKKLNRRVPESECEKLYLGILLRLDSTMRHITNDVFA